MILRDFSIVIVHYQTPQLLQRLLESLRQASLLERTVVVDSGSSGFDVDIFEDSFAAEFICLPVNPDQYPFSPKLPFSR